MNEINGRAKKKRRRGRFYAFWSNSSLIAA